MATDNQAVTAYLPPDLVESMTQYCTEYHITHKDGRPKLGTGIVELLKAALSGEAPSPVPGIVPSVVPSREDIEDMIRGVVKDTLPSTLPNTLSNWDNKLETAIAAKLEPLQEEVSNFRQQLEELAAKIPPSPENAPSELPLEDTKTGSKDETSQSHDEPVTEAISEDSATEAPPSNLDEPQQQELQLTEGSTTTEPQPTAISTPESPPETEESQTDEQSQAEEKLEAVEPQHPESGLLTLDEAHALAQSRGYKGKKNALRMRIRDKKIGRPEKVKEEFGIEYVGSGGRESQNSRCYRDMWEWEPTAISQDGTVNLSQLLTFTKKRRFRAWRGAYF